jgi:hypothetical protein
MILRRFDDDASMHLIAQRGHDPNVFGQVYEVHYSVPLTGMMMLHRHHTIAVTPKSLVGNDLFGGQHRSHFEMRG